jgi:hypothetical protein
MYSNFPYIANINPYGYHSFQLNPYVQPDYDYNRIYSDYPYQTIRQQAIRGHATWTDGGPVTKCGIPWSYDLYMTAAVGENSPFRCRQNLKIRNLSVPGGREIIVTVVDQVRGYPANRINLHRRAFEALGADPSLGVIDIEILPHPELEEERWGKYLLELTQIAYPGYNIIDFKSVGKFQPTAQQTKETYDFILQSPRETIKVRGNVIYNPVTDRVLSFNLKEVKNR